MTELEKSVANALRLSEKSGEKLLTTIQRNIKTARADLIRLGVSDVLAESENILVEDAIITFCQYKMDDESMREQYLVEYKDQADNIRKSTITTKTEGEADEE